MRPERPPGRDRPRPLCPRPVRRPGGHAAGARRQVRPAADLVLRGGARPARRPASGLPLGTRDVPPAHHAGRQSAGRAADAVLPLRVAGRRTDARLERRRRPAMREEALDRRVRCGHARARAVLVGGPDGRRTPKPDIAAPTNVAISGGACGGTSCAAPHAGGAAALLLADDASRGIPETLRRWALDAGDPGLRLTLRRGPAARRPGCSGARHPDGSRAARHRRRGARAASAAGREGHARRRRPSRSTASRSRPPSAPTTCSPHRSTRASWPTGRTSCGSTRGIAWATPRPRTIGFTTDNTRPSLQLRRARHGARGLAAYRANAIAADGGTGLAGAPAWKLGDGSSAARAQVVHRYARPGRYTVAVTVSDRAANSAGRAAIGPRRRAAAVGRERAGSPRCGSRLARPGTVRVKIGKAVVRRAPRRPRAAQGSCSKASRAAPTASPSSQAPRGRRGSCPRTLSPRAAERPRRGPDQALRGARGAARRLLRRRARRGLRAARAERRRQDDDRRDPRGLPGA